VPSVELRALAAFRCTGSACPDNCCQGPWAIPVEPDTLQRWSALPAQRRKPLFAAVETAEVGDRLMQVLRRRPDGKCVHLATDGWCSLQQRFGSSALPAICRDYPRLSQALQDGSHVRSAWLSCPEMARLCLFDHEADQPAFVAPGLPASATVEDDIETALAVATLGSLANAHMPVGERIAWLTLLLGDIGLRVESGELDRQWLAARINAAPRPDPDPAATAHGCEADTAGWLWAEVVSACLSMHTSGTLGDAPPAVLLRLREQAGADLVRDIGALRDAAAVPMHALGDSLARYFTVSLVNKGFPWQPPDGHFTLAYVRALLPLLVVFLRLWIAHSQAGALRPVDAVRVVYQVERFATHRFESMQQIAREPRLLALHEYGACLRTLDPPTA